MKVLIADDNKSISSILSEYAQKEGYQVIVVENGSQALEAFDQQLPDIVLLDVMMPIVDGFTVCRKLREISSVPIIMITARGEDYERIMGLDIGADDYIVKPFSPSEVMARIRSVMRRFDIASSIDAIKDKLTIDNLVIDLNKYSTSISGQGVQLTKKEFEILWLLSNNIAKVYSREQLLDLIWGYEYYGDSRTVDTHIKRLRAKLEVCNHPAWDIKTIWGVGYKFDYVDNEE